MMFKKKNIGFLRQHTVWSEKKNPKHITAKKAEKDGQVRREIQREKLNDLPTHWRQQWWSAIRNQTIRIQTVIVMDGWTTHTFTNTNIYAFTQFYIQQYYMYVFETCMFKSMYVNLVRLCTRDNWW